MMKGFKTKAVSDQLGVNPTTIQRWIKYFNIPCQTNEQGHYLIAEKEIGLLKSIKDQLNDGLTMKEILEKDTNFQMLKKDVLPKKEMIRADVFEQKLEQLMIHIEQLERKLSVKADEVVEYQVLQHRSELDSLFSMVSKIDERMRKMEQHLAPVQKKVVGENVSQIPAKLEKPKKNKLMRIFSL
ncbi:hypothetical protein BKP35_02095 [Anaerobacillus arseniciselenatis]|uniref:Chromosome-anchoring protein RacA n=1 Tax=Anaerobacillus arseniciselenatis TaxID=85682 RepID=A0A1S2LWS7_9BACI|nr:chromosome-anchoring protein RacA [Anaerobacillus arseniciselenatis]OIJ15805.1 hypothetical protein BKP35_02095 [Anaerobacillus arseniciselenatis]